MLPEPRISRQGINVVEHAMEPSLPACLVVISRIPCSVATVAAEMGARNHVTNHQRVLRSSSCRASLTQMCGLDDQPTNARSRGGEAFFWAWGYLCTLRTLHASSSPLYVVHTALPRRSPLDTVLPQGRVAPICRCKQLGVTCTGRLGSIVGHRGASIR
jgi:hypothetical protein